MSDILALAGAITDLAAAIREANAGGAVAPQGTTAKSADKPKAESKPKADAKPKETRDYEKDIRPPLVALSKKSREAMSEVLGQFTNKATGEPCTKGAEVDPAEWDALLAATAEKMEELDV